ncbi:hypothetical protein L6164_020989 [Bauhinia variegata]|uniref:Uncharacterized protein n=1 Tax=Bauhinia variegata TaxID=167791 RepID=A0ACB9MY38_BAUVA|nr:hypothetical protein L6164_020989 [Bauhinia variegata]
MMNAVVSIEECQDSQTQSKVSSPNNHKVHPWTSADAELLENLITEKDEERVAPLSSLPSPKYLGNNVTVEIVNALDEPRGGPTNLTLHCKSKNDDLGFHTLAYHELYSFRFQPNPVAYRTLYFCSFSWRDDPSLHYVDIYYENRDDCSLCSYKIFRFGACRFDEKTGQIGSCLSWKKEISKQIGV